MHLSHVAHSVLVLLVDASPLNSCHTSLQVCMDNRNGLDTFHLLCSYCGYTHTPKFFVPEFCFIALGNFCATKFGTEGPNLRLYELCVSS